RDTPSPCRGGARSREGYPNSAESFHGARRATGGSGAQAHGGGSSPLSAEMAKARDRGADRPRHHLLGLAGCDADNGRRYSLISRKRLRLELQTPRTSPVRGGATRVAQRPIGARL